MNDFFEYENSLINKKLVAYVNPIEFYHGGHYEFYYGINGRDFISTASFEDDRPETKGMAFKKLKEKRDYFISKLQSCD